jgi:phosphoglucosamine mutase
VRALPHGSESPQLIIGRDTRESGSWIEAELAHGASGEGAIVMSGGIVPTPAIAYLARTKSYDLGVVVSRSRNSYEHKGLKVCSEDVGKVAGAGESPTASACSGPSRATFSGCGGW